MDGLTDGKLVEWIVISMHEWTGGWMEDREFIRGGWRLFSLFILIDCTQYIFTFITVSSSYITSDWTFSSAFTRLVRSPYIDPESESLPIYICVCALGYEGRKKEREK